MAPESPKPARADGSPGTDGCAKLESQKRFDNARAVVKSEEDPLACTQVRIKEMGGQSALQKESAVAMPENGLVWTISGKPGEQVDADHLVMEIINRATSGWMPSIPSAA